MSDDEEWPEWRVEELRQILDELVQSHMDKTFAGMVDEFVTSSDINISSNEVILFGVEGQIDAVMSVSEPLPPVLYRPIRPSNRFSPTDTSVEMPSMRRATYHRIGDRTYQREAK